MFMLCSFLAARHHQTEAMGRPSDWKGHAELTAAEQAARQAQ